MESYLAEFVVEMCKPRSRVRVVKVTQFFTLIEGRWGSLAFEPEIRLRRILVRLEIQKVRPVLTLSRAQL